MNLRTILSTAAGANAEHRCATVNTPTDHVFRLNRKRVEGFSGVAEDFFRHLEEGVEQYRREIYAR